mmetsp:Transcript_1280/g.3750  ORF Transcript_1280/g.3750 Transcript_1280/m.3750 type:complete len:548 (+) Transcript_1280:40-1683(+)
MHRTRRRRMASAPVTLNAPGHLPPPGSATAPAAAAKGSKGDPVPLARNFDCLSPAFCGQGGQGCAERGGPADPEKQPEYGGISSSTMPDRAPPLSIPTLTVSPRLTRQLSPVPLCSPRHKFIKYPAALSPVAERHRDAPDRPAGIAPPKQPPTPVQPPPATPPSDKTKPARVSEAHILAQFQANASYSFAERQLSRRGIAPEAADLLLRYPLTSPDTVTTWEAWTQALAEHKQAASSPRGGRVRVPPPVAFLQEVERRTSDLCGLTSVPPAGFELRLSFAALDDSGAFQDTADVFASAKLIARTGEDGVNTSFIVPTCILHRQRAGVVTRTESTTAFSTFARRTAAMLVTANPHSRIVIRLTAFSVFNVARTWSPSFGLEEPTDLPIVSRAEYLGKLQTLFLKLLVLRSTLSPRQERPKAPGDGAGQPERVVVQIQDNRSLATPVEIERVAMGASGRFASRVNGSTDIGIEFTTTVRLALESLRCNSLSKRPVATAGQVRVSALAGDNVLYVWDAACMSIPGDVEAQVEEINTLIRHYFLDAELLSP